MSSSIATIFLIIILFTCNGISDNNNNNNLSNIQYLFDRLVNRSVLSDEDLIARDWRKSFLGGQIITLGNRVSLVPFFQGNVRMGRYSDYILCESQKMFWKR